MNEVIEKIGRINTVKKHIEYLELSIRTKEADLEKNKQLVKDFAIQAAKLERGITQTESEIQNLNAKKAKQEMRLSSAYEEFEIKRK